jgi:YceI-like domain
MIRHALLRVIGHLRRGFGWRLWAFALVCLIVLACAETSFGPRKSRPDQQSQKSPVLAVALRPNQLNFIPESGSHVELQGHATIGSWTSRSTDIHSEITLDADAAALNALFDRIQSAVPSDESHLPDNLLNLSVRSPPIGDISVPIMSLHGDSGAMDSDMQNALNVTQHPSIDFVFEKLQQSALQWNPLGNRADLKLRIVGKLNMAGASRPIAMDVIVKRDSRGRFLAHAQTKLLMTDFGVTPPGALFGLIKAGDQVVVVFDLDLNLVDRSSGR